MQKSETYLDFCFVRKKVGHLSEEINAQLENLFKHERLNWYLDEKENQEVEIIVAEVKGMSSWGSEQAVIDYLEEYADENFWSLLQGYQFQVIPVLKGC
ncbi:hypothetical protein [Aquibacillus albus]|uniref:Uncharacterized protein n=1 Tax=Aquibacillus albus TaxID=1168171 RepID=A0ABS2MZ50_9BACI|nr:hypothetical protein [Aquibacillus albus]MBM7570960.1 hypothetical protein [Aquibacillus albus]